MSPRPPARVPWAVAGDGNQDFANEIRVAAGTVQGVNFLQLHQGPLDTVHVLLDCDSAQPAGWCTVTVEQRWNRTFLPFQQVELGNHARQVIPVSGQVTLRVVNPSAQDITLRWATLPTRVQVAPVPLTLDALVPSGTTEAVGGNRTDGWPPYGRRVCTIFPHITGGSVSYELRQPDGVTVSAELGAIAPGAAPLQFVQPPLTRLFVTNPSATVQRRSLVTYHHRDL